jgi:FHA domain
MAKLVISPGTPQAHEYELKPGINHLGRGFANDFKIEDPSVSSSHAEILVNGSSVTVRDLGSTNGTFVNRAPITNLPLQSGQWLRLGGVEMLFEGQAQTEVAAVLGSEVSAQVAAVMVEPRVNGARIASAASAALIPPVPTGAGLKMAGSSPSLKAAPPSVAATVADPPLTPPIITPVSVPQAAKKSVCKFHAKSPARWLCPQCGQFYCDLCVGTRKSAEGTGYFCRPCGAQCSPVALDVHVNDAKPGSFFSLLPGTFAYPFKHGGALILVCGTVFFAAVDFLKGFSFYLQIVFYGYLFAYMQNVIQCTARGDESEADLPDITNFVEDIVIPCLQLLAIVLLSFGPAIGVLIWSYNGGESMAGMALIPAIILGCLYFPMGFLAVAMFDTVTALNPLLIVPSVIKVPLQYLIACFLLVLVFLVRRFGDGLLQTIIPVIIIPDIISSFIGLYFLTVQCRILGLLYLSNKQRLGWFKR